MIIKEAEDRNADKAALQGLLSHPAADANIKKRIEQEIRNIQAGMRGEAEAAYEMKVRYVESRNWMVIHDLRIEHNGLVAQIDHMIINRWLDIWVCESKHFAEGIAINEHGEFTAFFGGRPYGVPSPIEQNNRHILILKRMFDSGAVNLPTRLGFTIKPSLRSLVLVSKAARIIRPKKKFPGLEAIIKTELLFKFIDKAAEESNPLTMAKMIGSETLHAVAKEIARLHRPISFDWAGKFGLREVPAAPVRAIPVPPVLAVEPPPQSAVPHPVSVTADPAAPKQKLICSKCGQAVSYAVAKFCWFNKPKFGGNVYCMDCQKSA